VLAFAMMAVIRHRANAVPMKKNTPAPCQETSLLIRWSIQEIRRIATRLARKHIQPEVVIAWSLWRRAHQAQAKHAHMKSQL